MGTFSALEMNCVHFFWLGQDPLRFFVGVDFFHVLFCCMETTEQNDISYIKQNKKQLKLSSVKDSKKNILSFY